MKTPISFLLFLGSHLAHCDPDGVVLYDLDFRKTILPENTALSGDNETPFPKRTLFSEVLFGEATVVADAPSESGEARKAAQLSGSPYGQVAFSLISVGYAFHNHRIETRFRIANSDRFTGDNSVALFVDGGVFFRLDFNGDGTVNAFVNRLHDDGIFSPRVLSDFEPVGTFDPTQAVHLILETWGEEEQVRLTINGEVTEFDDLASRVFGIRNGLLWPGPLAIRLSHGDEQNDSPLLLQSFQISGHNYAGPLLVAKELDLASAPFAKGSIRIPIDAPSEGLWIPEFSLDSKEWMQFAAPQSSETLEDSEFLFGPGVGEQMFIRLVQASE